MCVVGCHSRLLTKPTRFANVNAFSLSVGKLERVPIVDAAILYECPFKMKSYILVLRNALYVEAMSNNLIPPFVLREAGLFVNETAKIHVKDPTVDDHCIQIDQVNLRIPLALWGIFSYFPRSAPTDSELNDDLEVVHLTPDTPDWNPNSDIYARNEEAMLDWRGDIVERQYQPPLLLEESDINATEMSLVTE